MPRPLLALLALVATTAYGASSVRLSTDDLNPSPLSAIGRETYATFAVVSSGDTAHDVTFVYVPPAGTTFGAVTSLAIPTASVNCTTPSVGASGNVTCTMPLLPLGTVWITIELRLSPAVAAGTTLTHSATVTTPSDPSPSGKSATFTTTAAVAPTLEISTSYPSSIVAGVPFTYIVSFRNSGTVPATNVVFFDDNDGFAFVKAVLQSAGNPATCRQSFLRFDPLDCRYALAPGESVAFAVTEKPDPTYPTYPVSDTFSLYLLDFGIGQSAMRTAIATALDDVAVTVASPAQAPAGVDFPVRVAVSSAGQNLTRDITLTIPIPPGRPSRSSSRWGSRAEVTTARRPASTARRPPPVEPGRSPASCRSSSFRSMR